MTKVIKHMADYRQYFSVRWLAVAVFAIVITYGDGFLLTALQGAIGAIERLEPPFTRWLRDSTYMLPVVFLVVLLTLVWSRGLIERRRGALAAFAAATLVITLAGSAVSITEAVLSSIRDYQYQSTHLELVHSYGGAVIQPGAVALADLGGAAPLPYALYCNLRGVAVDNAVSLMEYATFMVHVRALLLISALLLITNLVFAALLLVMLKDHLWSAQAATSQRTSEVSGQLASGNLI